MPYMVIDCSTPNSNKTVYIRPQILDIGTMSFCSVYTFPELVVYSCLPIATTIVHLNTRCFSHCLCHLELGVLQQLKLLQGLGMVHRPQIVYDS